VHEVSELHGKYCFIGIMLPGGIFRGMRQAVLEVKDHPATPATPFMIDYRIDGRRRRQFFKTRPEADAQLRRIKIKLRKEGEQGLSLSDDLRTAALLIQRQLEPYGKTLRDAGAHYLAFLQQSVRSITVSALRDEYLAMKKTKGLSEPHLSDLHYRFKVFTNDFGDKPVRTVTAKDIEEWLNRLNLGPQSVNNYRSRIRALFGYAFKHGYADRNVVEIIDPIKFVTDEPEIWTPGELIRILDAATPETLPLISLGAFAGIRPKELTRLNWQDVNFTQGEVTVGKAQSKTASRRVIKMEPCLCAWLVPFAGSTGPLTYKNHWRMLRTIQKVTKAAGIPDWRSDGFRHSFASYHYARYNDAARTAADLGHSTTKMLFAKYRSLVQPSEAAKYWSIFPSKPAENVVNMSA
jgi:integrase